MAYISRFAGKAINKAEVKDVGSYIHDYAGAFEAWVFVPVAEEMAVAMLASMGITQRWTNKEFICIGTFQERRSFLALHDGTWWVHNVRVKDDDDDACSR